MKKSLILTVLAFVAGLITVSAVFQRSPILNQPTSYTGIVTNNGLITTNLPTTTNMLVAAEASSTNTLPSAIVVGVASDNVITSIALVGTNAAFNGIVVFNTQKSYDNVNWVTMTNLTLTGTGTTTVQTNVVSPLGDYYFVRLLSVMNTNTSSAFARFEFIAK